ncbi:hypothetical protein ACFV0O_07540 [Kitasatospora sp. NPDC059577]|uniref:hypothetical protein n=1 Tax=Kitasatospora sp. NPDC059577 TaxID=3346873 RepID=UPI0036830320
MTAFRATATATASDGEGDGEGVAGGAVRPGRPGRPGPDTEVAQAADRLPSDRASDLAGVTPPVDGAIKATRR